MYILLGIHFLSRILSDVMRKKNSTAFSVDGITGSLFYVFETSLFALFYFWALNGFHLEFNSTVILYGFIYGIIVIISLIPSVFVYNYASFAFISFVSGSMSLILSLLMGMFLFSEVITVEKLLRVVIMLCATAVMFIGRNSNKAKTEAENESKTEKRKKLIIVLSTLAFMSLIGAASTAVLKYYSADTNVTDQNSFFFITNIFSAFLVLPVLPFTMKRDKIKPSDLWKMVKSKKTIYSAVTTLNSNINSIVMLLLLGMMDVSIYTPLSSAFTFAAVAVATPIIGEKLNRYTIIATVFAILSVVLPAVIF